jgi:LysM repeat protein
MTTDNDEFWGDEAGWSTSPERDGTTELPLTNDPTPARGIGGKASRLFGSLLTSGSTASRAHGVDTTGHVDHGFEVGSDPQVEDESNSGTEEWDEGWEVEPTPVPSGGVDPLLAKFGGAAVVLTLLIPVALGFRSGSDEQLIEAAAAAASSAVTSSNEVEPAEAEQITADAVESAASEPTSTSSANSVSDTPSSDEATPVESATPTSDARSVSELSGSTEPSEADSSSDSIAAPAEAEEPAVRVEPVCPGEYEVVLGDFWIRIADGAGVTVSDLLELNGAGSNTPLYPGSSICLPEGARTPPPPPPVTQPPTTAPATTAPATTAPATTAPATTAPPATVAPTTAPTTAAPAPPTPTAPADIEQIIRDVWPDELEERALEIAWRESNYVPTAKNYCCYGIFQMYWDVHKGWLSDMGITSADQLYDPTTNARAAYALYERAGGWGPWGF